jgi:tetratricopeptide (TPR) repeat protein
VKITPPLTPEKNRLQQKLLHAEMDLWMLQGKYREAIQTLTHIKALTESAGAALSGGLILKEALCRAALDRSMETLDVALSNLTEQELPRLSEVIALWIQYRDNPTPAKQDPEITKEIENNDLIHGFKGVLSELREDYETSLIHFEAAGADAKSAIVLVHLGDEALASGEYAQAQKRYALAHTLFEKLNESCGVALCTYRLAELAHQEGQSDTFRNHLTDFEKTLANCPSEIFREGAAILNQLRQDSTPDSPMQFPTWHWHHFTDRITIDLFLSNGLLLKN